jgi:hypothetical protein
MLCYPFFKIISMASVIGAIGTVENVDPETQVLFLALSQLLMLRS